MLSDSAQIASSLAYDINYDLCNHDDSKGTSSLASVSMHPHETYWPHSGLYQAILRYDTQEIHSLYGLSLLEYLELPRDMIDMITHRAMIRPVERDAAIKAAQRAAEHDKRTVIK